MTEKATAESKQDSSRVAPPAISLPKGGGAIRGIGEKFAANPVTGTGSLTVPIATSPGRAGFGPQLSLSYDSGSGNGPFGFGWSLSIPSLTRKTDKGLPQYLDGGKNQPDSDVYILSGAEDLVPVYRQDVDGSWVAHHAGYTRDADGFWVRDREGNLVIHEDERDGYLVRRYRPRIEGLFARIERWTSASGDVHWRSISKDNILTIYGKDENSRIFDPNDHSHIFSWLISETRDDKGNAILYKYAEEDGTGVDLSQVHERNRGAVDSTLRQANRYLRRIFYGNRTTLLNEDDNRRPAFLNPNVVTDTEWMFEVIFDYDEGYLQNLDTDSQGRQFVDAMWDHSEGSTWKVRDDPFSSYRAGFEVRTYRLCQRVLMIHHFSELGRPNYLARSTDFAYRESAIASFLTSVTHSGYLLQSDAEHPDRYLKKSLPPVEFDYSRVPDANELAQLPVRDVDAESLENLPYGFDGTAYQWVDLDGEGLSGILTEQADGWFYKRNLSPIHQVRENGDEYTAAQFGPVELVAARPAASIAGGQAQFMDLAGDGQVDLVQLEGPLRGFYERTDDATDWVAFRPFAAWPNLDMRDPNLKFVDLTGDGHANILITEDEVFTWYPSLAEAGFGAAERTQQALDEEQGPRLVFADGTQSIYLADLSGDGLSDLVRLRNGEVCYWPNLGYGRFGAKVTMDDAPWFDAPDQFDQRRIRLADIDGSSTTDILYLGRDDVRVYFNQSGNRWAGAQTIPFPKVDNVAAVQVVDLLGNGTACLVWSSPLPGDGRSPMRYIDLMGGQKPHLLITVKNNLGAETHITYTPSTRFYLEDRLAGKPWITRLAFPVHVVEKVSVTDKWRGTTFSTTYSYHHGYFDGAEREFRGFGRVEQVDVEDYGRFTAGNANSPYITDDMELYQPPVKTVTWFHTGAFLDRERILSQFEHEYFPRSFEALNLDEWEFQENILPEPDLMAADLDAEEWREALRACKGMTLRQEIYELHADALKVGEQRPVKLFSTAYHNCHIQRLQPRAGNPHAVFLVTESEAITYHYELDLTKAPVSPDPRVAHTLNLKTDEYGNILQAAAVVYPRLGRHVDSTLPDGAEDLIAQVQREQHIACTETRYTKDVLEDDDYRLRLPCEVLTYEVTGIETRDRYFTLDELRRYRLSTVHQADGLAVEEIHYHEIPNRTSPQKRIVEHARSLFFNTEPARPEAPLSLGQLDHLGLPYESYKLALTNDLLEAVFTAEQLTADVRRDLSNAAISGYLSEGAPADHLGVAAGEYWVRSGIAGFAEDAARHFYLPERYIDPFENTTELEFDDCDLYLKSSKDPLKNMVEVDAFDFRVLAPQRMRDINNNLSEVRFDVLGLPTMMAVLGKGEEADNLRGIDDDVLQPGFYIMTRFFGAGEPPIPYDEIEAQRLLGNATARHVYSFGEERAADGAVVYGNHPPCAAGILREKHVAQLASGEENLVQVAFDYSDGSGNVLVKKIQAEPETPGGLLRWIASGKTILNNKGKPVKQYEPYFSDNGHRFDEDEAAREVGVTPIMYYDAPGRLVRTEFPDGSYSRVEFSPWHVTTYDQNDTVLEPENTWYTSRASLAVDEPLPFDLITQEILATPDQRAAWLAAQHADTPSFTILDSLGRDVIAIAHNKYRDRDGVLHDDKYVTFTKLDAEGKPLWIRDARRNLVMQYITPPKATTWAAESNEDIPVGAVACYDIAGNLLFQHSMDAGDRWTINDAASQPFYAWDVNNPVADDGSLSLPENRLFHTTYDELRRPLTHELSINGGDPLVVERFDYGESLTDAAARNLRGQAYRHYDPSGLVANERFDFKGNLLEVTRRLARDFSAPFIHWLEDPPESAFEAETFTQRTNYDALNRMVRQENWHREGRPPAIYIPQYSRRGLLQGESLTVNGLTTQAILNIEYDAKGQRLRIQYGNGTTTRYDYDPQTFRLVQLRTTRPNYNPDFPNYHSNLSDDRVLQQLSYTYDPSGNITEIYDEAFMPVFFNNEIAKPRSLYTYDAIYRLTVATGRENHLASGAPGQFEPRPFERSFPPTAPADQALRNYTQYYTYDFAGNLVEMHHQANGASWTRHYETALDSNRLLRTWVGGDELTAIPYTYDIHGSMLNLDRTPEEYRLRWDYRDMIHIVNLGGGGWAYYNYDAGKQRTRKRVEHDGSTIEERFYLGGMEWYRRWVGSSLVEEIETHHLFGDDQRALIVEDVITSGSDLPEGALFRYQYSNHLGSATLELDAVGEIINYEEYRPYGTSAYHACNAPIQAKAKRYRYTGMERDEESGLNYHTARYYAPWLGRWASTDPIGIAGSINVYQYGNANPINRTDPSGAQSVEQGHHRFDPDTNRIVFGDYFPESDLFIPYSSSTTTDTDAPEQIDPSQRASSPREISREETLAIAQIELMEAGLAENDPELEPFDEIIEDLAHEPSTGIAEDFDWGRIATSFVEGVAWGAAGGLVVAGLMFVFATAAPFILAGAAIFGVVSLTYLWFSMIGQAASGDQQGAMETLASGTGSMAGGALVSPVIGRAYASSTNRLLVEGYSRGLADLAQSQSPRPGMAGSMILDGELYDATSVRGPEPPELHSHVQEVLDAIPAQDRGAGHGRCVEPQILSQALSEGVSPRGGVSAAAQVTRAGHPSHGLPRPPCPSCQILLRYFRVRY